ncbi:MAG: hypothetical protein JO110_29570 [Acetobacteraceae bacterium]|nr:hypothetical protein [Acetobacteraceae bacterium]
MIYRLCAAAWSMAAMAGMAHAQTQDEYMKRVMAAAPPQVVQNATIVRMENGGMQTLQKGSNQFTCMVAKGDPMCLDPNAMEWANAWQTHAPPPDKTGFVYMLAGDTGASNTDPYATDKKEGNHWIETGSHVMVVGPAVKTMVGYPRAADPDPTKPYVMWAGTPYEHLMIPVR